MKILRFIIYSNILIALAATALSMATQVGLSIQPRFNAYLVVIFFATLFDYNFHLYLKTITNQVIPDGIKYPLPADHPMIVKGMILVSLFALVCGLFFVSFPVLILLCFLALPALLYTLARLKKPGHLFLMDKIPGLKTIVLAAVWSAATIIAPALDLSFEHRYGQIFLQFIERFTFIFAIAIPFDIRDMMDDNFYGIKTIPIVFGARQAFLISAIALLVSLTIATVHYWSAGIMFLEPFYIVSIAITLFILNHNKFKHLSLYYHGLIDGCILLQGILICLGYFIL